MACTVASSTDGSRVGEGARRRAPFQVEVSLDIRQHALGLFAVVGQHGDEIRGEAAVVVGGEAFVRLAQLGIQARPAVSDSSGSAPGSA